MTCSMLLLYIAQIYSLNEANSPDWDQGLQQYVQDIKQGNGKSGQRYSSRYIGSMVGDVHRYVTHTFWRDSLFYMFRTASVL
jgi:fructose-1,6-bisphosphatase